MRKFLTVLMTCFVFSLSLSAGNDKLKRERMNMINLFHMGVGADWLMGYNDAVGTGVQLRLGHNARMLNYVITADHYWDNKSFHHKVPYISSNHISLGVNIRENLVRKGNVVFYTMEGVNYNIPYNVLYNSVQDYISDDRLMRPSVSTSARVGVVFGQFDLNLHIKASLWPDYSQKYIYESYIYDYSGCRSMINSRWQFGLSFIYHIDL